MTVAFADSNKFNFKSISGMERPIFRRDCAEYTMFYTPGYLCVVAMKNANWFESTLIGPNREENRWNTQILQRARRVPEILRSQKEELFSPECLTLYLNSGCNLGCIYCYAGSSPNRKYSLKSPDILPAAELVARNCRSKEHRFYVAFHGGGEPTLHEERLRQAFKGVESVARDQRVELFSYIATNGVMPERTALWLSSHFDLVGVSCDGPADIQNRQRPIWGGDKSAENNHYSVNPSSTDRNRRLHLPEIFATGDPL